MKQVSFRRRSFLLILSGMILMTSLVTFLFYRFLIESKSQEYAERYLSVASLLSQQILKIEKTTNLIMLNGLKAASQSLKQGDYSKAKLSQLASEYRLSHFFVIDNNGNFIGSSNEASGKIPNLFSFSEDYKKLLTDRKLEYLVTPIISPEPEIKPYKFMTIRCPNGKCLLEAGLRMDYIGSLISETTRLDPEILSLKIISPEGIDFGDMKKALAGYVRQTVSLEDRADSSIKENKNTMAITKKIEFNESNCAQCVAPSSHYYFFQMEISKQKLNLQILAIQKQFVLGVLLAMLLSIMLASLVSKRLVRGVEDMSRQISEIIRDKNYSNRLASSSEVETTRLSTSFNALMDELSLQKAKALEFEKHATLVNIASQVAHDIRGPLSAIEAVVADGINLPIEKIDLLKRASLRIQNIASDLLSRSNGPSSDLSGGHLLKVSSFPVVEAIREVISEKHTVLSEFGIGLELADDESMVLGDSADFKRALSNLLDNSIEAVRGRSDPQISLAVREQSGKTGVYLIDNGCGIPAQYLARVGECGFTFGKKEGNGLGVSYAISKIKEWGGSLQFSSKVEQGTVVTVSLVKVNSNSPGKFAEAANP
jgi:signal transduction histidine kinase